MVAICPTVTATDLHGYRADMERVLPFAQRLHIDLMDGHFAPSLSPELTKIWWPHEVEVDIHLMYEHPMECIDELIRLRPNMVVIHNEADVHHMLFAAKLHQYDIKVGLAVLHDTPIEYAYQIMHSFDHVLIFSGHLGYHGGQADLGLLDKVQKVKTHHPEVEIGWDGGINDQNARQLVDGGVQVLNIGGFIQAAENPKQAYQAIQQLMD
jgi:ribulose-phosphate 3-epimerase